MSCVSNNSLFIRSFERAGPISSRFAGCDSCKIRKKRCPRRFNNEGHCIECQRLGLPCVRDHPSWLDDIDQLNSFRRGMLQAVKLSRRNRHQVPRQSPTLRHGGGLPRNTISPSGHDSYSHSETAFVDNPIARTGIAAPHPPYEEQLQLPFSIIPYCTPPTSITSTNAANVPTQIPGIASDWSWEDFFNTHDPVAALSGISDLGDAMPPTHSPDPPCSQLQFFVDYLRSYHPYVRRIVIETDDRSRSVSTLEGEAAQINMIGSMGHQAMVHISRCPRQAQFA